MKKTVSMMLAFALIVSGFASLASASLAAAASVGARQVQLTAVMPANVKSASSGAKNYIELVDVAQTYKSGNLITLAAVFEMKNAAKDSMLLSVANKPIDLRLTSSTVDLSYGIASSLVAYAVPGLGKWTTLAADSGKGVVSYNAASGGVTLRMNAVGNDDCTYYMNGEQSGYTGRMINNGLNVANDGFALSYAPFIGKTGKSNSGESCVWVPAVNSANTNNITTPNAVRYAFIITGSVKPIASGLMKAEMLVSSKQEFKAVSSGLNVLYPVTRYGNSSSVPDVWAEARVLTVDNLYTIIRFFDRIGVTEAELAANIISNPTDENQPIGDAYLGLTNYLSGRGYSFASQQSELGYLNRTLGTMELFQIYQYDSSASYNAGSYITSLISEATRNPAKSAKCLWAADCDFKKLMINENKYYYAKYGALYDDDPFGAIMRSSGKKSDEIVYALTYYKIPLGIGNTKCVVEGTFVTSSAEVWSNPVTGTYVCEIPITPQSTSTPTPTPTPVRSTGSTSESDSMAIDLSSINTSLSASQAANEFKKVASGITAMHTINSTLTLEADNNKFSINKGFDFSKLTKTGIEEIELKADKGSVKLSVENLAKFTEKNVDVQLVESNGELMFTCSDPTLSAKLNFVVSSQQSKKPLVLQQYNDAAGVWVDVDTPVTITKVGQKYLAWCDDLTSGRYRLA